MTPSSLALVALAVLSGRGAFAGPSGRVTEIACAPWNENVAAAIVDGWVWVTRDGGAKWSRLALLPNAPEADDDGDPDPDPTHETGIIPGREEGDLFTESLETEEEIAVAGTDSRDDELPGPDPVLAVSNEGRWAFAAAGKMAYGGPEPGVEGFVEKGPVNGLLFDGEGRLWVAAGDFLEVQEKGAASSRLPSPDAGAPVRGSKEGEILVPGATGLRIIDTADPFADRLSRGGPVEAVAAVPNGGGRLVSVRGAIERWGPAGREERLFGLPRSARRILVDVGGDIRIKAADGTWWERAGGTVRPALIRSADVDAAGRFWFGTETGPVSPNDRVAAGPIEILPRRMADHLERSRAMLSLLPGPPPCPPLRFNPVPAVQVIAGAGRGDSRGFGDPLPTREAWARSWAYVGIRLTWDLEPVSPAECLGARALWSEMTRTSDERLGRLWIRWRMSRSRQRLAADPVERFIAQTEAERDAALIEISSGRNPIEKEEK